MLPCKFTQAHIRTRKLSHSTMAAATLSIHKLAISLLHTAPGAKRNKLAIRNSLPPMAETTASNSNCNPTIAEPLVAVPGAKDNNAAIKQIESIISSDPCLEEPFYVLDLDIVEGLFRQWCHHLDGIHPFYAVKCNPEPSLLAALAALGADFDCASRAEIEMVLALGVSPDRIVYANPCKAESHVMFSAKVGVDLTTVDSVYELEKMKRHHPNCSLLLRIKPPHDLGVLLSFGSKCGALPEEVEPILRAAQSMNLPVVGVAFHIGTAATVFETYDAAIESAREVFDLGCKLGMPRMHVLDIGGGFTAGPHIKTAGSVIGSSIKAHFGDWPTELRVMAEPGRYFAEKPFTLATRIIGKRVRRETREYWINDGIYGSMLCVLLESAIVSLLPIKQRLQGAAMYRSTVFGPTLDSLDVVRSELQLPELEVGEWMVSPNMGAYTKTLGSDFNGFFTSAIKVHLANSTGE